MVTDTIQQHFLEILRQNNGIIHKVCRLYCYSEHDRQDLFQEIVVQVWKAFPTFRQESKISTWIYRIALNTAISGYRKQQRMLNTVMLEADNINIIYEEQDATKNDKFKLMHEAISQLTDIEKALVMLYLEDKSYEEMEEIVGMSQGNLRVKMSRIKDKLRKNVAKG